MDNKPRKREKRVGSGSGNVFKRGSGLGTGPVGSGRVPGSGGSSGSGGSRGYSGSGRPSGGGSKGSGGGYSGGGGGRGPSGGMNIPGGRGGCGIGLVILVVVIIVIVMFGGRACSGCGSSTSLLSGLSGGSSGSGYGDSGSGSGYYDNYDYDSSGYGDIYSLLGGSSAEETWAEQDNTEELDTSVADGSREKYTQLKGNGDDVVTLMVYLCGTDLESKNGMATADLIEMTKADIGDNVNLLVYTGGCTQWKNDIISSSQNQIYRVTDGGLACVQDNMGSGAMTDYKNLAEYINWASANYPANRYGLILWDHGSGSISGYGYDQKYPNSGSMTLGNINKALKSADIKFDFVGFDACLMATAETALMLAPYADYMIASEETEPGIGWYYTDWLTALSDNTSLGTTSLGKKIIDDFVSACSRNARGQKATLSIVDLAELSNTLPANLAAFANDITDEIKNDDYKTVATARAETKEFAASSKIDQIDLVHFAMNMDNESGAALAEAVKGAVKYNRVSSNINNAYGLSIYFPYSRSSSVDSVVSTYDEIGMSDEYGSCIKNFAALSVSGQVANGGTMGSLSSLLGSLTSGFGSGSGSSYGSSGSGSYGSSSGGSYAGGMSGSDISSLLGAFLGGDSGILSGFGRSNINFMTDNDLDQEKVVEYLQKNSFDPAWLAWQTDAAGGKYIDLTAEQWSLVSDVNLHVYFDDGEGYIDLGLDNVYEVDEDGRFLGIYDGTWLAINGQAVSYNHIDTVDDGENYTITGYVPALLNGDRVKIYLVFDNENPYGYIAGASYDYSSDAANASSDAADASSDAADASSDTAESNGNAPIIPKNLTELQVGDTLDFLCDYYTYEGVYSDSYMLGDQVKVTDEMVIENVDIGDHTKAAYVFTDIYGQDHWTETM